MLIASVQYADTPDAIALSDERVALSWRQMAEMAARGASALLAPDPPQPLRVAIFATNSTETVIAYIAALRAGVSSVPLNFHLTAEEAAYILKDSGASILFVSPETAEAGLAAAKLAGVTRVIGWRTNFTGVESFEDWLANAPASEPPSTMPAQPHLHYTSGTTGKPKGVETPPNMFPENVTVAEAFETFAAEVRATGFQGPVLTVSPLYHTSPMRAVRLVAGGAPLVTMARFDGEATLAAIEKYGVSTIHMTPTHFVRLLDLPDATRRKYDLSSLRKVRHTGAACPAHVKRAMIEWWGPVIIEVYGATESGPVTSISSEEWLERPGSVGRCIPPFEVEVYSEDGARLGANAFGVLYFHDTTGRGIRYFNDADKSARSHIKPGTFSLGEMGYVDDAGYVFVTDRISDMIVSGGVNIYPAEIEHALLEHPAIHDVAVIGVPNAEMGEEVRALVVLEPGAAVPSTAELDGFCRERLAGFKRPRSYEFVPDVGRNALGKVNKRALRAPYWADAPR
ncbi:acyl-CoA synthase [alpha proteobacterium U9-1i]|nr:acyl-CoA synthase [alpha proteobacterium U9-1i]